jgi:isochorismate synthase
LEIPAIRLFDAFASYHGFSWLFCTPEGSQQLGLGLARDWQWHDKNGLEHMDQHVRGLRQDGLPADSLLVGGTAFSPQSPWAEWPGVYIAMPIVQIVQDGGAATLRVQMPLDVDQAPEHYLSRLEPIWRALFSQAAQEPGAGRPLTLRSAPSREEWMAQVARAAGEIRAGRLEKVVLARRLTLTYRRPVAVAPMLENLRAQNPEAAVFALRHEGSVFLGATPELLTHVHGGIVESMSLAGSAPRGLTPEADGRYADQMLHDPKTRREHSVVRRHVQDSLAHLTQSLTMPDHPDLKKLPTVQHLLTPVRAKLNPDATIWSVVQSLHPTPAVAGYPREAAQEYIVGAEPFPRGWYAGAVGWTNLDGNGQWMVALRSGTIRGTEVNLYAGCGIMGDSDPQAELRETDWKFGTMLSALELEGESS